MRIPGVQGRPPAQAQAASAQGGGSRTGDGESTGAARDNRERRPPPNAQAFWDATMQKRIKGIREEFRRRIFRYQAYDCTCSAFWANPTKNRYTDVQCMDATRVVLEGAAGGGDYIHASWVGTERSGGDGTAATPSTVAVALATAARAAAAGTSTGDGTRQTYALATPFICTQGPMAETTADFWHMVWQYDVVCVVMLCTVVEDGRKKCEQYWPEQKDECSEHGTFSITNVGSERSYLAGGHSCWITTLEVCKEGCAPRTVKHLIWTEWADRWVPDDCRAILKIRKRLQTLAEGGPVVVHCSAGIGRTGTLASVDVAMAQLDGLYDIDIAAVVRRVREQRMHSVQTEQQYAAVYKSIIDYIRSRWPNGPRIGAEYSDFEAEYLGPQLKADSRAR